MGGFEQLNRYSGWENNLGWVTKVGCAFVFFFFHRLKSNLTGLNVGMVGLIQIELFGLEIDRTRSLLGKNIKWGFFYKLFT